MTGERSMFLDLQTFKGGKVAFGGNQKGKIIGKGTIGISSLLSIKDVLLVEGLRYSLLSISQLCDSGFIVSFTTDECKVSSSDDKTVFSAR